MLLKFMTMIIFIIMRTHNMILINGWQILNLFAVKFFMRVSFKPHANSILLTSKIYFKFMKIYCKTFTTNVF